VPIPIATATSSTTAKTRKISRPFMLSLSYIVWPWNRTDEETLISNCDPIVNA